MKKSSRATRAMRLCIRTCIFMFCLATTLFISANSFEIASGRDVPFLGSIRKVDISAIEPTLDKQNVDKLISRSREGAYGRPDALRMIIDKNPLRVVLAPGINSGGSWLARANTSHVLYITEPKASNAGDMVVYMNQSWRTIPNPEQIDIGTNMFIDTSTGWRYMFRAQEVRVIGSEQLIISEARDTQLILLIDQGDKQSYLVRSQFVSLQKIGL